MFGRGVWPGAVRLCVRMVRDLQGMSLCGPLKAVGPGADRPIARHGSATAIYSSRRVVNTIMDIKTIICASLPV